MSTKFVKVLRNDLIHHGFKYNPGLNVDIKPFNTKHPFLPNGLYFTDEANFLSFMYLGSKIADVTIPEDANVYEEPEVYPRTKQWKADKIILSNIRNLADEPCWRDENYCMSAVQKNGMALKYVVNQTNEICLAAVQQIGYSIEYVVDQTYEQCLTAVKKNPFSLAYIHRQTEELCLLAVRKDGLTLKYVKNKTPDIIAAAIKQNSTARQYV